MDEGVWKRAPECHPEGLFWCRDGQGRVTRVWQTRRNINTIDVHWACFQPRHPWATTASPAPAPLGVWLRNNRLAHKEKQGWPCWALSESLSSGDIACTNARHWTWWQMGTLQLDSAEKQLSHQCKSASFYLSRKHQADASPMILLLRAPFWLPWRVHPPLCFFWVFLLSFPFSLSCTMLCWLSAFSELQRNKRVNFSHEN